VKEDSLQKAERHPQCSAQFPCSRAGSRLALSQWLRPGNLVDAPGPESEVLAEMGIHYPSKQISISGSPPPGHFPAKAIHVLDARVINTCDELERHQQRSSAEEQCSSLIVVTNKAHTRAFTNCGQV